MFQGKNSIHRIAVFAFSVSVFALSVTTSEAASPENDKIAFVSDLTGTNQIYTINPDGTGLFQVTNLPPAVDQFALEMDFSPDGKQILFPHDMTGALELYTIHPDGSGLKQITHDGLFHAAPHWSPDGSHIVFATVGKYGPLVTATIRADGTDMKLLTTPVWESLGAAYTKDGNHIVFSSQLDGLVSALWIMDTDGKYKRRITDAELEAGPPDVSWTRNEAVFYTHQDTPKSNSIFKVDIDTRRATRLTSEGHIDSLPVYSPDGRKILYSSDRLSPGLLDLFVMDSNGSHKARIYQNGFNAFYAAWGAKQ